MQENPAGREKETVEIVYKYADWILGYGTVTRELVADFYDALKIVEDRQDFDDYMGIAMNLRWLAIGESDGPQIMRSQNQLLLPRGWKQLTRMTRLTTLVDLLLEFV